MNPEFFLNRPGAFLFRWWWLLNQRKYRISKNRVWYRSVYLKSVHWQDLRYKKLDKAGYQCEKCGAKNVILDTHHKTYKRLGFELMRDLEVLCRSCHNEEHDVR